MNCSWVVKLHERIMKASKLSDLSIPIATATVLSDINSNFSHEQELRKFLGTYGWTASMQQTLLRSLPKVAARFFICDDSGSMAIEDGKLPMSYLDRTE